MAKRRLLHSDKGEPCEPEASPVTGRQGYRDQLVSLGMAPELADAAMAKLFDHQNHYGQPCRCSCHARLGDGRHDDGLDCHCTWNEARREAERRSMRHRLDEIRSSPDAIRTRRRIAEQERAVLAWLDSRPGVEATLTCWAAPETWEGTVDGHAFFFRERWDKWRLRLDVDQEVPASGTVIARGLEEELGDDLVSHLSFVVDTIRCHLRAQACDHPGAAAFCPHCGTQVVADPE